MLIMFSFYANISQVFHASFNKTNWNVLTRITRAAAHSFCSLLLLWYYPFGQSHSIWCFAVIVLKDPVIRAQYLNWKMKIFFYYSQFIFQLKPWTPKTNELLFIIQKFCGWYSVLLWIYSIWASVSDWKDPSGLKKEGRGVWFAWFGAIKRYITPDG